ncbi:multicopper oxidase family protein [Puniceibacterium sediminis]|uniref:Multicopper oxidase with three cupredoxin domains (Includes cell division protein FtsP and spore coat protein CotA) n=1 Tax=Puniceibacterium sediminis TaxID=1608407 RepID=A0A238WU54_9RHOB|nr:multicopper oxidase family protein [Puniceibacterium sediminis]SNR50086.1 Multicopper oxidase with three cupredoxin domains (includes cell division protein FtsP and spore coat protein CotA) [Puniceibacterium sediminis]
MNPYLTRRTFLGASAAILTLPRFAHAQGLTLTAEPVMAQILPAPDPKTAMLGLNGMTPGPELRAQQGGRLTVRFENRISAPSALHWHGIRIDNAMDGVPGLTQEAVADGTGFDYAFDLPDAGTYWYHSHNRSWEQVEQGLYGPLIVEERNPPQVDHDVTVLIDDWKLEQDGRLIGGFGNMHDFAHAGRMGNFARAIPSISQVSKGDRLRLRLINAATARVFPLVLRGIEGRILALDGMPLSEPRELGEMILAPAQRIDVIVDVTGPVIFDFPTGDEAYELGRITIEGDNTTPITAPITALPAARVAKPSDRPTELSLRMEGGAMGGGHAGDDIWAFNGISGLPDKPFAHFERGETARITLINDTAFPHGIHLHGHHFHEVLADGTPGDLRDTTLVNPGESRDILAVFDNPGKWLLHCHMLGHQASGMKTWVEVA